MIGPAGAVLDALEDDGAHVLTMWAACAGGARVADGRLEALVYGPGQAWDVAAVALCVTEAGGRVSDMFGESVRFDGPVPLVVAAAPGVFDNLTTTLRRILG